MDLAKILLEMTEISPDLKNFAENCSFIDSVEFLRVLGRKPANLPVVFGFWRWRPAVDHHRCQVGRIEWVGRVSIAVGHF